MGPEFLGYVWGSRGAAPAQVTGLAVAVVSTTALNVTCDALSPAPDTYRWERSASGANTFVEIGSSIGPAFSDTGLTAGTTYYYRARGRNAKGDGAYSSVASGTTAYDYPTRWGAVADYPLNEASGNALADLGGLDLTLHGTCAPGTGAQLGSRHTNPTGTQSGYFDHADNVLFQIGNFDYALPFWMWVAAADIGTDQAVVSKDAGTAGFHLRLQAAGTLQWIVRQAGGADFARVSSGAITADAWNFVLPYVDVAAPEVGISLNGGAFATAAGTGTPGPGAAAFSIANLNDPGVRMYVKQLSLLKPPAPGIGSLKAEIRDRIFAGHVYPWS